MSEEKNSGFVTVRKEALAFLCKDCLIHIQECRKKREDIDAKRFMDKHNQWAERHNRIPLIGKWWPSVVFKTIEETKQYMDDAFKKSLKDGSNFGFGDRSYDYHSEYAWGTKKEIEHLLSCCGTEYTKDDILVDVDLYHQIVSR